MVEKTEKLIHHTNTTSAPSNMLYRLAQETKADRVFRSESLFPIDPCHSNEVVDATNLSGSTV
jgi:hypothetical protein